MRTLSALWQAYQAQENPTWYYDYKCVIDGEEYTSLDEISGFSKSGGLISDDFSLGNCVTQTFNITVLEKSGVEISKNAKVEPYICIVGNEGTTEWVRIGVFFIDARQKIAGGKMKFTCYDRMLYAEQDYLTDGESLEDYPVPMSSAMDRIYAAIGCVLDSRCTISSSMEIEYPNDMTMRQVLGMIASAHGGNFIITEEDELRLVIPAYDTSLFSVTDANCSSIKSGNTATTYDSVAMIYTDDGSYFESGETTDNELEITNYWATQAMCDAVHAIVDGYTYAPYTAKAVDIDPAIELGDHITIDGIDCNLWVWSWNSRLYCDISIPSSEATAESEFQYTGTVSSALSKKVALNAAYYGAIISRSSGLTIEKNDNGTITAKAIFNSDTLAMQALKDGVLTNSVYFDAALGKFVFDGELSADVITALSAVIAPNLYADKATISELTVDQLDTSNKAQKYLSEDTSDVNYVKVAGEIIQFLNAAVSSTYGSTRTSSGTWDMTANTETDTYYANVTVDDDTGAIAYSNGLSMDAYSAYNAGRLFRAIDATSFYKLTGTAQAGFVAYEVRTVEAVSVNYEQATNRQGELLYWTDDTHTAASATETDYPVYVYKYNERPRTEISFADRDGTPTPQIILGSGTGVDDVGKGFIYKGLNGIEIRHLAETGKEAVLQLDSYVDATMRRLDSAVIDKTGGSVDVTMEGETEPTTLTYTETADSMTFTWPDSHTATISIS